MSGQPAPTAAAEPIPASPPDQTLPSTASEKGASSSTAAAAKDEELEYLGPRALNVLILSLLLVVIIITLDASILATAIPKITDHFHTIADIGWYAAAYMITNASCQPLTGKVYTYFSLKHAFLVFVGLFELGSLICAVAQSSTMLVVGRAVAGIGASGLMNGSLTIIAVAAPPQKRPTVMGIIMAFAGAGQLVGPLIGGALTQHASWRWCFWINVPVGAVTIAVMAFIQFPPYKNQKTNWTLRDVMHDWDLTGFALFAPACIMLLLGLQWGGTEYPWDSARIIGLLCGAAATFVVFFVWEWHHGDAAMIPLSIIRRRVVYSSMLTSAFAFGGLLLLSYYLPLWFQVIKGATPTMSAVYILPTFGLQIFSAILVGALTPRVGYLMPFSVVGAGLATIAAGLMTMFKVNSGASEWVSFQVISGIGRGMSIQQPIQAVQAVVSPSQIPTATAAVAFAQTLGAAMFLGLAQTAFLNLLRHALHSYAPDVDASAVIAAGATNYLANLAGGQNNEVTRREVLKAYNNAITQTFFLAVGCAAASFFTSMGIGRTKVAQKKKPGNQAGAKDAEKAQPAADKEIPIENESVEPIKLSEDAMSDSDRASGTRESGLTKADTEG